MLKNSERSNFWLGKFDFKDISSSVTIIYNNIMQINNLLVSSQRAGTGIITRSELKYFYTAFMDVGKLGEEHLDEITNNALKAMTSVSTHNISVRDIRFTPLCS